MVDWCLALPVATERWSAVLYVADVLLRPGRSSDVRTDDGSTVDSRLHPSLPWLLNLDPDQTRAPLWMKPLLSWTPGHKSSPGGVSHCWVSVVSRRLGCGSCWDWALRYQWPVVAVCMIGPRTER